MRRLTAVSEIQIVVEVDVERDRGIASDAVQVGGEHFDLWGEAGRRGGGDEGDGWPGQVDGDQLRGRRVGDNTAESGCQLKRVLTPFLLPRATGRGEAAARPAVQPQEA